MSFLEYQDEMYLSAVKDDACLIILSRGIGLEQLMVRLCRTYSDDTNLVIIIGTDSDDELFITNQIVCEKDIPYGKVPQKITHETSNTKKRKEVYMNGGIVFVTERILVTDLLSNRIPIDLVSGIIVYKAHKIYEDCLMKFILRLYREKNKTGFVKALSQNPQSFLGEYNKLERIMSELFVTSLQLWPRFQATIQSSLAEPKAQPEVIEISLPMNQTMKNIQFDLMDLIGLTLKELAKTNTTSLYDSDELTVENAINKSFDRFIVQKTDLIWHQLSPRAKKLIKEVQFLRHLLYLLTHSDVATFYNQTRNAHNSVRMGNEVPDWITLKPADRLFKLSKERIYPNNSQIADFDAETDLKWKAYQNLIDEIDIETKDIQDTVHVFVIVANDSVAYLLKNVLKLGAVNVLRERINRFNAILRSNNATSSDAIELFGILTETCKDEQASGSNKEPPPFKRKYRKNPASSGKQPENNFTLTQIVNKINDKKNSELITIDDDDDDDDDDDNTEKRKNEENEAIMELQAPKRHCLKLHYFRNNDKHVLLETNLVEYKPKHVIMYDLNMHIVRQIEVYQALHCHPHRCKVYTLQYENSADMQQYLTSLRREKEAFEDLIKQKSTMAIPKGRDGKTPGHPGLERGDWKANETTDSINTRKAGGQVDRNDIIRQKILVDTREFRSKLPLIVYNRGIDIEPIQLEIGDYILSSDICVERKSVSDLIQSLQSGRLYNQAAGRYWGTAATGGHGPKGKNYSMDLVDRLILLTIHHPNLRIIWSPSTYFTAEVFEFLKAGKDQPDATKITTISSQELPPETFEDKYDIQVKDFLLKLPGVNTTNVFSLMNYANTIADIIDIPIEELEEILGNSRSAELLHQALHFPLAKMISDANQAEKELKKSSLFNCTKRRKGLL